MCNITTLLFTAVRFTIVLAAVLSLPGAAPSVAKGQGKAPAHRVAPSPPYVRAPANPAPVVRCRHGVWDPYGVRCDGLDGR